MDLLVVMDPVETVRAATDTSFGLMLAAQGRGHGVWHCGSADLSLVAGRVQVTTRPCALAAEGSPPISLGEPEERVLGGFGVVLVRTDPPFDGDYLALTLLLEHARHETFVVNDPRGLREANEKLYACHFPDLMAPTVVSARPDLLLDFAHRSGSAVLKPVSGHGGRGVHLLRPDDPNARVIVAGLTDDGRRQVMAQQFLPGVYQGDKRILLLDGEPLGAIVRRPTGGDFRANIGVGGTAELAALDGRDLAIVEAMAARLRADGLWFVGIDVIDGRLSEVNVTSPTGIRQLARLSGTRPEERVLSWLEDQAAARR
jgi:glutathione synthase